jgi:hypothetical protein
MARGRGFVSFTLRIRSERRKTPGANSRRERRVKRERRGNEGRGRC